MKLLKYIKHLLIILLLINCRNDNDKKIKENSNKKNKLVLQEKTYINGSTDDSNGLKYFNIINDTYLFSTNHKQVEKHIVENSLKMILDSLQKPQLMNVWIDGDTIHHARIFVSPGDSISFRIKDKQLEFNGENAVINNFYIELEKSLNPYYEIPYTSNIYLYKKRIQEAYNERLLFLDKYKEIHKDISDDFIVEVKNDFKYQYLHNLIIPRSKKVDNKDYTIYISDGNGLRSLIKNENNAEKLFDEKLYFEGLSIDDFKNPELLSNSFFKNSINPFIRDYFLKGDYLDYSQEKFIAEKEYIQQNFEGDIENYAIARMIRDYNVKGFGYSKNNIEVLRELIDEYENKFTKSSYHEKMNEIKDNLEEFNFELPPYTMNAKVLNPIGDTLTIKDVLKRTYGKVKVIDFWASWCPPCIREIKKAKNFKNNLYHNNNVEWIYLSIDKDKEEWLKKSFQLQRFFNTEHQYLLLKGNKSSLSKSFKISGIPRYVILDGEERIILDHAPAPSDSLIFKKIIDKINL